jgi:hypothetical protein
MQGGGRRRTGSAGAAQQGPTAAQGAGCVGRAQHAPNNNQQPKQQHVEASGAVCDVGRPFALPTAAPDQLRTPASGLPHAASGGTPTATQPCRVARIEAQGGKQCASAVH